MDRVLFKKPDFASLKKARYICIDMHIHSEYSIDSNNKVTEIIKRAKKLGIGIAITDHNEIKGSLEAYKHKEVLVIPAIEARSKEGLDILFYFSYVKELTEFYNKFIKPNKKKLGGSKLTAVKLIEKSKKYSCISCLAHPYRPSPTRFLKKKEDIKPIFDKIKGIEVINSKNFRISNKKAINF